MEVSFVIPTLESRATLLAEAMASIEAQHGEHNISALVGVDHDRVGPATVRNRLIDDAETPWLAFLDDDDTIHPTYLSTLAEHTATADVIYAWCERNFEAPGLDREFKADDLRRFNFVPVTAIVRTSMVRAVGGFPENVAYEDWGLWLRLLDIGAQFTCVPQRLWTYRRQPDARTHSELERLAKTPPA